jgi:hypothetical protein
MPTILDDILRLLGHLLGAVGFGAFGFGAVRFLVDAYRKAAWQVQVAMILGLFGLFVGLANFSSPGSAGAFALGCGMAFLASGSKKTEEEK